MKLSFKSLQFRLCFLFLLIPIIYASGQKKYKLPHTVEFPLHGGQWEPGGRHTDGPLTTIIKNSGWTYDSWRTQVGNKLIASFGVNVFHDQYTTLKSDVDGHGSSPSDLPAKKRGNTLAIANQVNARIAKEAAFLYFINMQITVSGGTASFSELSSGDRTGYRDRAMAYLNSLDYQMLDYGITTDHMQYESKAFIMALEAFDLLVSAPGGVDADWAKTEKLDLQYWGRNTYILANDIIGGSFEYMNNYNLMTSAALGLAAIVLNDCGGGWTRAPYQPDRWANRANWEIMNCLFSQSNSQSNADGTEGYGEGPHYFQYAFENLMPMFIAYHNFLPGDFTRGYKRTEILGSWRNVRSYFFDPAYKNLMNWYSRLILPNGFLAPVDDTYSYEPYGDILGCYIDESNDPKPDQSFNWYDGQIGTAFDGTALEVEYISNANPANPPTGDQNFVLQSSGIGQLQNLPFTALKQDDKIQLITLSQKGHCANGKEHQHADLGSFMITAGQDQLIIDPGYLGYDVRPFVRSADKHNSLLVSNFFGTYVGPDYSTTGSVSDIMKSQSDQGELINTIEQNYSCNSADFKRSISSFGSSTSYYYVIKDFAKSTDGNRNFMWNVNGAGNVNQSTLIDVSPGSDKSIFEYKHPCVNYPSGAGTRTRWGVRCAVAVVGSPTIRFFNTYEAESLVNATIHGDDYISGTTGFITNPPSGSTECTNCDADHFGYHTRVEISKENITEFKVVSVFIPFQCGSALPDIKVSESTDHADIFINGISINGKLSSTIHTIKKIGPPAILTSPFDSSLGLAGDLEYNAAGLDISFSHDAVFKDNYCYAKSHFRNLQMDSGTNAKFQDTSYVESDSTISVLYSILGRCRYYSSITNYSGATAHVKFYLPDTLYNGHFIAFGDDGSPVSSSWDSINKKITIFAPAGISSFYIQLDNPCQLNCFFPPTAKTIDSVFDFNNGLIENLDHDLDIKADSGRLNITSGSVMSICSGHYLANQDTLYMVGSMDASDSFNAIRHDTCSGDTRTVFPFFHNSGRLGSGRSMIIINNHSALVLEGGSNTFLDANSTILVKKGGTLYIAATARVQIGGISQPGYAEIVAEDSSYVCIENGADMKFFANPYDSTDKNIFYLPAGYLGRHALAGRYSDILHPWIFDVGGRYGTTTGCIAICSLKDNGIMANPQYGWFNAGAPFAYIDAPDTMCIGDTMAVSSRYSRNVAWFRFRVCNAYEDGGTSGCTFLTTCDTGRSDYCNLAPKYTWLADHTYKLILTVFNECGDSDSTSHIIYIVDKPLASFTLPDSACPGIATFTANGSASTGSVYHRWIIQALDSASDVPDLYDTTFATGRDTSYLVSGSVSSSFGFSGFRLKGGRHYKVTLKVYNHCGVSVQSKTINIPLDASILNHYPLQGALSGPLLIYNTIGPDSVILHGHVQGQDSFSWKYKPASGGSFSNLSGPALLDKTVKPTVPTLYVLRAKNGSCLETDTILVNVNQYANAGNDTTMCRGDSASIGVPGVSLPVGYTSRWRSSYHVKDTTQYRTKAAPDSTVTYTLNIYNGSSLVETDQKTVFIDTLPAADFLAFYSGTGFKICFTNESYPYSPTTKFMWHFGDGDSSALVNPCHSYVYSGHDSTYSVCLKITNSCGDSIICDSLFIPADSANLASMKPEMRRKLLTLASSEHREIPLQINQYASPAPDAILNVIPNPTTGLVKVRYHLNAESINPVLVLMDMQGRQALQNLLNSRENTVELNLSSLHSGIYAAYIKTDNTLTKTIKIVLVKP
jgi:hypothetical protein